MRHDDRGAVGATGSERKPRVRRGPSVERRLDGRLWARLDGEAQPVRLVRCFPWSSPTTHLSLRNADDEEVALVSELAELDRPSRRVLFGALVEAGFVLDVLGVDEIEEDVEIRRWKVRTRQGQRSFQTALDAWPRESPDGALLVEDVGGDLYRLPPAEELDAKSRKLVWAFLD
jgi:hypothetical protein